MPSSRDDRSHDLLADLGRFSEPALLILISVADGPKHGYAMIEDIETMTGVRFGPGTLYGAIARLESRKLIEPAAAVGRRQPYRLTAAGARLLKARLDTLQNLTRVGQRRLASAF